MSDLISRQAAIYAMEMAKEQHFDRKVIIGKMQDVVRNLPSAQPERKKGRWILTQDENYEYCTCSECGYQNGENWMIGSDIPFCAECGADMRGDKDGRFNKKTGCT